MNRPLLRSSAFIRAAKKVFKKRPDQAAAIESALELWAADAFDPRLRSHKFVRRTGRLMGLQCWL
jgi:hypothetical protein